MTDADGRTHTIERLRALLNRLAADDLTLAEAAVVRAEVFALTSDFAASSAAAPAEPAPPADRGSSPFRLRDRPRMACGQALC